MLRLRVCKNVKICSSYCMQFHTTKLLIIEPLFFELVNVNNPSSILHKLHLSSSLEIKDIASYGLLRRANLPLSLAFP